MLTNNIQLLKGLWKTKINIGQPINSNMKVTLTKSNEKTLIVNNDEKEVYLHSKYDPVNEAQTIINQYSDRLIKGCHVIFYGLGFGYHIQEFIKNYGSISYSIYEPNVDVFYHFINNFDVGKILNKNLNRFVVEDNKQKMLSFIDSVIGELNKNIIIIELPSYKRIFKESYECFVNTFNKKIKLKRGSIHTNFSFQKRWTINSMLNFSKVLTTPNILIESGDYYKGKTALLVAAGPSLNEEIENIRYIKENKLAYIFSVGSSINTLIHYGIKPDFACTYDPGINNKKVFENVVEKRIDDIPLIFGSSVGYETIKDYPGPLYHFITSQDTVSSNFLITEDKEITIDVIDDAASIAIITLQLLYKLGFRRVVLIGQNLAYKDNKFYSDGISYGENNNLTNSNDKDILKIKDVQGNDVYTNSKFFAMKIELERYIHRFNGDIDVINTTMGGAHIEGTTFSHLKDVINTELSNDEKIISNKSTKYNKEHINIKLNEMNKDFSNINSLINRLQNVVEKINRLVMDNNTKQLDKMFLKLDESFFALKENKFFLHYILPMNRLHFDLAVGEITAVRYENNIINKAKKIEQTYSNLISFFKMDIQYIEPIYNEMIKQITEVMDR